jgi:2-polyprenyl-3-methyl-5-hydroxy-6-metoxy-1,4-benzoquinol methylase
MSVDAKTRLEPKSTLQDMEVHNAWMKGFRTTENDRFFGLAFDYIASVFGPPDAAEVVDAGCGSGTKSMQLIKRGFKVRGLDFSAVILEEARADMARAGVADRISFAQEDLTQLTLPTASVKRALCWGVVMHVPDIAKAIAELSRVIAPGGTLIISEGNFRSVQMQAIYALKKLLGRKTAEMVRTPAGIEAWEGTSTGKLMTRRADIPWHIAEFERHGLKLVERRAGQFTEIYTVVKQKPVRLLIHAFNNFWFRFIRWGGPSLGNILVLRRPG